MNRGSAGLRSARPAFPTGFNEAPIHESGKYGIRRLGRAAAARFNEAPIHESGKFGWTGCPLSKSAMLQ